MFKRLFPIVCALLTVAGTFSCTHQRRQVPGPLTAIQPPKESKPRAEAFSRFLAATMLERQGSMDQAIEQMRAAADLQPTSSVLTLRLIRAYVRNQDYENARVMAERAVKQMPDKANLWVVLGEIYHQLNNYDKAVQAFQKAIELDPENVLGYGALVSVENPPDPAIRDRQAVPIPLGFLVDIPRTWETADSIAKLEGVITAMNAHLATSIGLDSASQRQVSDCNAALAEILDGRALHDVQIKIAIPAENTAELKKRVDEIKKQLIAKEKSVPKKPGEEKDKEQKPPRQAPPTNEEVSR